MTTDEQDTVVIVSERQGKHRCRQMAKWLMWRNSQSYLKLRCHSLWKAVFTTCEQWVTPKSIWSLISPPPLGAPGGFQQLSTGLYPDRTVLSPPAISIFYETLGRWQSALTSSQDTVTSLRFVCRYLLTMMTCQSKKECAKMLQAGCLNSFPVLFRPIRLNF